MYFTKVFFMLVIAITLYLNFSEAGQQAGKIGQEAMKATGKALKQGAKVLPPVAIAGYVSNCTVNININTHPECRPGSPSGEKQKKSKS